ncbi:MAG: site-specific DNA-methyltransferase, partial [Candidatus Bathyarchaeia archaeon]
ALSDNVIAKENIVMDAEVTNAICEEYDIEDYKMDEEKHLEAEEDGFEPPKDEVETDIVLGDLFEIGEHRLLCGDSTDSDAVANLMNGVKADMIHTDPPYNIAYEGGSKKREKIENDDLEDFPQFLLDVYLNLFLFTKEGGAIYVWHASSETHNFISKFIEAGFLFKSYIVWNKNNSTFGRSDYHWKHEPCVYGWKEGAAHKWYGDRKQTTVWDIDRPSRSDEHPTMKPIPLCSKPMENSSKIGDVILDVFLGSGSTMVASHQLERKCYGMELDPKYCQVIIDRMKELDPSIKIKRNGEVYK